eukprot:gene9854-2177_t
MKILCLTLLSFLLVFSTGSFVTVETKNGMVRGLKTETEISFLGIPFAEKPRRWSNPAPKRHWKPSTFNATNYGFICPQTRKWDPRNYPKQDEDCLNLNIWTPPNVNKKKKLPVVIYIHGGAFDFGLGSRRNFRGNYFASLTNTIHITLNYRVGALGWLDGVGGNGNYGLMDQRIALEWIKENIEAFGGDSKKITLTGQSAGAMSVLMHLVSTKTRPDLFQKVVFFGSPFAMLYRKREQNKDYMKSFAINLGCKQDDRACYERQKIEDILKASSASIVLPKPPLLNTRNIMPWMPTIDGVDITNQPLKLIKDGKFKKHVEVLVGYNRDEAADFLLKAYKRSIPHWQYKTLMVLWMTFHAPEVLRMYPPKTEDGRYTAIELGSDYYFYCSGVSLTEELVKQNINASIFVLNHSPNVDVPNGFPACSGNFSCHSAELSFVWGTYRYYDAKRTEQEKRISTEMMNAIAGFAHDTPIVIPKYTLEKREVFGFGLESKILKDYRGKQCKMWHRIGGYFNH